MDVLKTKGENLGYAGFLFKKTVQPNSLRSHENKLPIDFLDSNIFIYINKKIKELKKSTGKTFLPKEFYEGIVIPTSIQKKFSKKQLLETMITQPKKATLPKTNTFLRKKENSQFQGKKTSQKMKFTRKPTAEGIGNHEKLIRNVLYEKIPENKFEKCFKQFKRETLVRELERMVAEDDSILNDSFKRKKALNQVLRNYETLDDKQEYIQKICDTHNLTLSSLLEIDEG